MQQNEIIEGNRIIEDFAGNTNTVKAALDMLQYDSSWDWQIPVWGKICLAVKSLIPKLSNVEENGKWYFKLLDKYATAVYLNKPQEGHKIIVELIKWYNENNQTK